MPTEKKVEVIGVAVVVLAIVTCLCVAVHRYANWVSTRSVGPSDVIVEMDGQRLVERIEGAWLEDDRVVLRTASGDWNLPSSTVRFAPVGRVQMRTPEKTNE